MSYERPGDADGNPELGVDAIEDLVQSFSVSLRETAALVELREERDRYLEALTRIAAWPSRFSDGVQDIARKALER